MSRFALEMHNRNEIIKKLLYLHQNNLLKGTSEFLDLYVWAEGHGFNLKYYNFLKKQLNHCHVYPFISCPTKIPSMLLQFPVILQNGRTW